MSKTRILLADDSRALLAELRSELEGEFEIVGTVSDGEAAFNAVLLLNPDVLLLDITMPVLNGLQTSLRITEAHLGTKILFLSIYEQPEFISAAFSAGGSGYVTKRQLASDLAPAIRELIRGNTFISPSLVV